jgi:hypothetical protein
MFNQQVRVGELFGFQMFEPPGPFPRDYDSGIKAAIEVLYDSRQPGQDEPTKKFSSSRKVCLLNTNLYNASARGATGNLVFWYQSTRYVATRSTSDSKWFQCFMTGLRSRVGERRKRDAALSLQQMLALQHLFEETYDEATTSGDKTAQREVCEIAVFYLLSYCASLRGFKVPKIVLHYLRGKVQLEECNGVPAHVAIPMRGAFKARTSQVVNLICYCAARMASGLEPSLWVTRLIGVLDKLGIRSGWLFQDKSGNQCTMSSFSEQFVFGVRRCCC